MKLKSSLLLQLFLLLLPSFTAMGGEISVRRFEKFNAADGLADNSAQTIYCMETGQLVITTMGQINFYDGVKFSYLDRGEETVYPLSDYKGNYHIYFDNYNHLWLKDKHMVTCVDLLDDRFVSSIEEEFKNLGMQKKVRDLFVDKDGELWLLGEDGLFNSESKKTYKVVRKENLQDVETYKDEYLLMFFEDGMVEVIELSTGETIFTSYAYGKEDYQSYSNTSVIKADGNMFYQIRNGEKGAVLQSFEIGKWKWNTILKTPYHLNNLALANGQLYIPSEYGYWLYDTSTKETVHVEMLQLTNGKPLLTDINVIAFDHQGGMWAGTEKRGLLYSRPYTSPFSIYPWEDKRSLEYAKQMEHLPQQAKFRGKDVNCVYQDSRHWTWVGTSQGLQLYKEESDHLPQVITKTDGLLNNVIHAVVEDKMHNIWVSTSYGISCIAIEGDKTGFINSYNQYDFVPNESFVNGRALCLPDGIIVMQALDHVITFNPSKMQTLLTDYPFSLSPKLIKMLVNGEEVKPGKEFDGNVILIRALSRTNEINLNYDQNSLALTFSAFNYFRPQQTYYRVRVKGYGDENWHMYSTHNSQGLVDSRGQLHLPLVSLPPGTYIVEVQASMTPTDWRTEPKDWIININEPWWRTTGMFALFAFIFSILLGINIYFYVRNVSMRARRNNEEQGILKRIKTFAERCSTRGGELLEPTPDEIMGEGIDPKTELTPEFVDMMVKLQQTLLAKKLPQLSMRSLSMEAGLDIQKFYSLVTSNIYKSPRALAQRLMLDHAEELLNLTDKSVLEISNECGFISPNFFIACFYREYKMTPKMYKERRMGGTRIKKSK